MGTSGIRPSFPGLSRSSGQIAHVLLTRSPLGLHQCCHWMDPVRLACVKHAASVRPEPGSNSPSRSGRSRSRDRKQLRSGEPAWGLLSPVHRLAPRRTMLSVIVLLDRCARRCPKAGPNARTSFWLPLFRFQGASLRGHTSHRGGGVGPLWPAVSGGNHPTLPTHSRRQYRLLSGFPRYRCPWSLSNVMPPGVILWKSGPKCCRTPTERRHAVARSARGRSPGARRPGAAAGRPGRAALA